MLKGVVEQSKSDTGLLVEEKLATISTVGTENSDPALESSVDSDKKQILVTSNTLEEAKSDDATSVPDEECPDTPTILSIDFKTKNGTKRLEVKKGEEIQDVMNKLIQEYELSKELETAIEYKIKKAVFQIESQHRMFQY